MKKQKASISKEQEIQVLQGLMDSDCYFSDSFSDADIQKMQYNVKNDFPLTLGIQLSNDFEEVAKEKQELENCFHAEQNESQFAKEKADHLQSELTRHQELLGKILVSLVEEKVVGVEMIAREHFGNKGVAVAKLERGLELSKEDREYLLEVVK